MHDITTGRLRDGTLDNVQWHLNGSHYIKNDDHHEWKFTTDSVRSAWDELWKGLTEEERKRAIVDELAVSTTCSYLHCH